MRTAGWTGGATSHACLETGTDRLRAVPCRSRYGALYRSSLEPTAVSVSDFKLQESVCLALHEHSARQKRFVLSDITTRNLTKSQLRNLLSIAKLNNAKSRVFSASCSHIRIPQISFCFSCAFCLASRPLFDAIFEVFLPTLSSCANAKITPTQLSARLEPRQFA